MNRIQMTVRRALDRACHPPAATLLGGRLALVLTLIVTTLGAAFGPPASVSLASEPAARYQLVVKEVLVHNDHEGALSGKGDMKLTISVILCPEFLPSPCFYEGKQVGAMVRGTHTFKASTGEAVAMNRVVPAAGDEMVGQDISPELGFYAIPDYYHLIRFDMVEDDGVTNNEPMGWVIHSAETAKNGAGIGTFTLRSLTNQGTKDGDYTITFEVRPIELPDVRPARIEISDLPNSTKKHVCAVVQNIRDTIAGPFMVGIYINGSDSEGGKPVIASLAPGAVASACVDTTLPATGEYQIRVALDEPRRLTEFNEVNNVLIETRTATPSKQTAPEASPTASSAPAEPTPDAAQADLTVAAIKVNSQVPDGKDDCKDGTSSMTVVVKNRGTASAGAFAVRLKVDGAMGSTEQTVNGLEAGKEREVKFENVRLNKGEHTLTAVADAKNAVDESNEENNDRDVTARCKDAS